MNLLDTAPRGRFTHCHFDSAIIIQCVRGYLTYQLSYRALVAIKAERSVDIAHSTILTRVRVKWPVAWEMGTSAERVS